MQNEYPVIEYVEPGKESDKNRGLDSGRPWRKPVILNCCPTQQRR